MDFSRQTMAAPSQTPSPLPKTTQGTIKVNRDNNFNVLRLAFASLVLLCHSFELIDGSRNREILTRIFGTISFGEFAVDGFFLLSGWLIVQSWQRKPELFDFLKRRVLRIYPGFLVASAICGLVIAPLAADPTHYFAEFKPGRFAWDALFLEIPAIPPVFQGLPHAIVNGSMWTIAYEFRCYVLVALIGVCGGFTRRWLWLIMTAIATGCMIFPTSFNQIWFRGSHILLGRPGEMVRFLAFFGSGGCFYLYRDRIPFKASWALVAACLLFACMFRLQTAQFGLIVMGAYLLFWFVFAPIPAISRFRELPDVSYGVYLYGWPVQMLWIWYVRSITPWFLFPLGLIVSVACGWLSWTYVERMFLQRNRRVVANSNPVETSLPLGHVPGSG